MVIRGHVQNGVIVLDGNAVLPDGARVTVSYPALATGQFDSEESRAGKKRVQLPLVQTDQLASVHLTSERIAEILDEEDAASTRVN